MPTAVLKFTSVPVTSPYGERILKATGKPNLHEGADTATGSAYPHSAFGDGVVVASPQLIKHWKYGWYIRIRHADGIETSHHSLNKKALFKKGQTVRMGDIIGHAGESALSAKGKHVHNALWLDGKHVDPLKYLTPGKAVTVSIRELGPLPSKPTAPAGGPSPIPVTIPSGDTVFIAIRNGHYYLAVPRHGQYTLIPLGADGNANQLVPKQWFTDNTAWATFKVCVGNPGVLRKGD